MIRPWLTWTSGGGLAGRAGWIPLAAALLSAGCGGGAGGGGGFSLPPTPVEIATVAIGEMQDRFTTVGSLAAGEAITVVAEIDAVVQELAFAEGQPLAAGALIARLDAAELAAQVARAEAVREQRQASYERIRTIVAQQAGAPQDLDDAAAALKVATAELDLARARLAKTRITAPFAGLAGRRLVSPGAYLRAGAAITDLSHIDELRVEFTAPERIVGQLERNAPVTVTTTAYPDRSLQGRIDVIDPALDPATRSARIVARVANPERLLRPGMSADVAVVLRTSQRTMTVPSEAVFVQAGEFLVYEVQPDSTVAQRVVALGLRERDRVEVLSGLAPGASVVRAGHQKLYPGARVLPVAETAAQTP